MSDSIEDALLARKDSLLGEVIAVTRDVTLVGDEGDAQRFIGLMEKRAALFEQLSRTDDELSKSGADTINSQIEEKLRELKKIDDLNAKYALKAEANMRAHLRDAANNRHINAAYNQFMPSAYGSRFDSKN